MKSMKIYKGSGKILYSLIMAALLLCVLTLPAQAAGETQLALSLTAEGTEAYALRFSMPSATQGVQSVQYIPAAYKESLDASHLKSVEAERRVRIGEANDFFEAVMTELLPGTQYAYRIGAEGSWGEWYYFSTPAAEAESFSFIYMSDVQPEPEIGSFAEWGVLLETAQSGGTPAFAMFGGDTVNEGGSISEWGDFFAAADGAFASMPLLTASGNHDYAATYTDIFNLPANGPEGFKEYFYSFDYANAHFIVMDSNSMGNSANAALFRSWLEADLAAAAGAKWKIVMFHHPIYNITGNSKDEQRAETMREYYLPLFEEYGVDLLLSGHQHVYSRTYPMQGGKVVSRSEGGITQLVTVSGPKHYQPAGYDYIQYSVPSASLYAQISIAGDRLDILVKDALGNTVDEYGWSKGAGSASEARLYDGAGAQELFTVSAAGTYRISVPVGGAGFTAETAAVILQLRGEGAGVKDKGAVFSLQSVTADTSQAGVVSFDIELPAGLDTRLYADIFYWDSLAGMQSVHSPLYGLTFTVKT